MGTVVSIEVRPPFVSERVLDDLFEVLATSRRVSAPTDPVRDQPPGLRRASRGGLQPRRPPRADRLLTQPGRGNRRRVLRPPARRRRVLARVDPSGLREGLGDRGGAGPARQDGGAPDYWINAGGDIVARGHAEGGRPWCVGIRHPDLAYRVGAGALRSPTGPWRHPARTSVARHCRSADRARAVGPAQRDHRRAGARLDPRLCHRRVRDGPRWPALARRTAGLRGACDHRRRADGLDRRDGSRSWSARAERPVSPGHQPAAGRSTKKRAPPSARFADRDPSAVAIDDQVGDGEAESSATPGRASAR